MVILSIRLLWFLFDQQRWGSSLRSEEAGILVKLPHECINSGVCSEHQLGVTQWSMGCLASWREQSRLSLALWSISRLNGAPANGHPYFLLPGSLGGSETSEKIYGS